MSKSQLEEEIEIEDEGEVKKISKVAYIIDSLSKGLPPTSFSGEKFAEHFNDSVNAFNNNVNLKITQLLQSEEITPEIQEEIDNLEKSKITFGLGDISNLSNIKAINFKFEQLLESKLPKELNSEQDELNNYFDNPFTGEFYDLNEIAENYLIEKRNRLLDNFKKANPTLSNDLLDQIINGETDVTKLLDKSGIGLSAQIQELLKPLIQELTDLNSRAKTDEFKLESIRNTEEINSLISNE